MQNATSLRIIVESNIGIKALYRTVTADSHFRLYKLKVLEEESFVTSSIKIEPYTLMENKHNEKVNKR